jgi:hypothetical protein
MRTRLMLASATTAALLAGAALAQNDTAVNPPSPGKLPPGAASDSAAPAPDSLSKGSSDAAAPSAKSSSGDASTVAPAAGAPAQRAPSAAAGTEAVTNGPIPDTKENRAKYGQPLSSAGKRTKAAGN